ncbi:family 43 glycosylhydrolase [Flavobacterium hydrophilum]|uniref:Glycosyl hydrolase family 43 n=1 Tax=Flavobacterium hydrophilum TaxID=2211445 RepID=A0A2V4C6J5_9FLAO|nr:family 43 glycosylhydrolase [Flavobacterium hydrophilum]PXY46617.1 glycosyl hydrolase family 43 [Flavobacterium hydrophilum]
MSRNNYFIFKYLRKVTWCIMLMMCVSASYGQQSGKMDAIYSGTPWFDQNGNVVSAHGANIIKEKDTFYLFGEAHTDTSNAFAGFNCYSSKDLYNWKFESIALPLQKSGKLGPNRVGERPKIMKCIKTGEFVMFMHADTLTYKDQFVGYAVSKNIKGPYQFKGPLLYQGKPIKKWDMGTFQDTDGSGYILVHGGEIYKLSDDFNSVTEKVNENITSGFESPTMLKKEGLYYFIGSHLTSWEKNDNYYYTSNSLKGPWQSQGLIAPEGTLTWNSQSTFVLPIQCTKGTTYMFMGDRWSFPKQASSATYVWQPLVISGTSLSIPDYQDAWQLYTVTGISSVADSNDEIIKNTDTQIQYKGNWKETTSESRSEEKDASFTVSFTGEQIALYSLVGSENGYAKVVLTDKKGKVIVSALVDMYSKFSIETQVFRSPLLKKGNYHLTVSVTGERPNWSDKRKSNYGSTGYYISISQIKIKPHKI